VTEVDAFDDTPAVAPSTIEPPLLLDEAEVCRLLSLAPRTFQRLRSRGQFPSPIKVGKLNRWRRGEVEAWVGSSGCGCFGG